MTATIQQREAWRALATLAAEIKRQHIGDEAYDALYDDEGNRKPQSQWQMRPGVPVPPDEASPVIRGPITSKPKESSS